MAETLWDAITDFLSPEAGQRRRRALNRLDERVTDAATYYVGPDVMRTVENVGGLLELSDAADIRDAAINSQNVYNDPSVENAARYAASAGAVALPFVTNRMMQEGVDVAGDAWRSLTDDTRQFVEDEYGGATLDLLKIEDPSDVLRAAQERARASTPTSWLDAKYERGFHPASNTKLGDVNVDPVFDDKGTLEPVRELNIEGLLGKVLTPAYGDRTRAGGYLTGYDDVRFNPVEMHGGQGFMRERGTGVWASEAAPMGAKAKAVEDIVAQGGDPRLVYAAMGAQSGDFSRMMADAVAGQLENASIPKQARQAFDDRMGSLLGDKWPGIDDIQAIHDLPGSTRWAVWQEMDRAKWRDMGFPDIGRTRLALTDRQLVDADAFDTGLAVGRPGGILSDPEVQHPTYNTQLGGEYEGDLPLVPGSMIWRDFFEGRRAAGASPASDQRAFMMSSPKISQKVDQQMVDEVNAFLEAQRRAGVLAPPTQAGPTSAPRNRMPQQEAGTFGALSSRGRSDRRTSGNNTLTPAEQQVRGIIDYLGGA